MYRLILMLTLFVIELSAYSQTNKEMEQLKSLFEPVPKENYVQNAMKENHNEIQWILSALFVFYKTCISSQDAAHCNFTPTCSVYGLQSVRKNGLLIGTLATIDRLMRCNGLNHSDYEIESHTGRCLDPVK